MARKLHECQWCNMWVTDPCETIAEYNLCQGPPQKKQQQPDKPKGPPTDHHKRIGDQRTLEEIEDDE